MNEILLSKKNLIYKGEVLGPELWRVQTSLYVVTVRQNQKTGKFMLFAAGTLDGEIFQAEQTFNICPTFSQATKTMIDTAFFRAAKQRGL